MAEERRQKERKGWERSKNKNKNKNQKQNKTKRMEIKADGGSTKVEWLLHDGQKEVARCVTAGVNPSLQGAEEIRRTLCGMLEEHPLFAKAESVEYYGAGCTPAASAVMRGVLCGVFSSATAVVVGSDIIGAAKALLGDEEGVACILGTGANSCLWDGNAIVRQTPALGFILGDEGSGAVLGKLFLNALYKGVLPLAMRKEFEEEYGLCMTDIIEKVYRQPMPNRWLASLSPFILRHVSDAGVRSIVYDNFMAFLSRNILPYERPDLPVNFVGSIAIHYREVLRDALDALGLRCGRIMKSPLDAV